MTTIAERRTQTEAADYLSCSVPAEVLEDDGQGRAWLKLAGEWHRIESMKTLWDFDGYWTEQHPVIRMHFRATIGGGRQVLLYQDLIEGAWYQRLTLGTGATNLPMSGYRA